MGLNFGIATSPSLTKEGRVNQDAIGVASIKLCDYYDETPCLVLCLADGMGSLDSPEQASSIAVRIALSTAIAENCHMHLRPARMIVQANKALLTAANGRNLGTTLTCIICLDNHIYLGHIGDGRVIHIRKRNARCITVDHTKLAEEIGVSTPSLEAVKDSPLSRKLSRSLGEKVFDESYVYAMPESPYKMKAGDHLILCSDGVWTEITEMEMIGIVEMFSPQEAAERLISLALERDPTDDTSAIVISNFSE
jgi:serine/threonine protein phosphatase PrpC